MASDGDDDYCLDKGWSSCSESPECSECSDLKRECESIKLERDDFQAGYDFFRRTAKRAILLLHSENPDKYNASFLSDNNFPVPRRLRRRANAFPVPPPEHEDGEHEEKCEKPEEEDEAEANPVPVKEADNTVVA